jgi:hypothetical protein
MTTKSAERDARLIRLTGDGENRGGGLPLPLLFQAVTESLLDEGPKTVEELVSPVERVLGFKRNRINDKDMYPTIGFRGLVIDALAVLSDTKAVHQVDGQWELSEKLLTRLGESVRVMRPWRAGTNGLSITLMEKTERERINEESTRMRLLEGMYNDLRADRAFEVTVKGKLREFRVHRLARIVRPRDRNEFYLLVDDIKRNGVREPVRLFEGQVLEGRHRLVIASNLGIPIAVENFKGTEEEARQLLVSELSTRRNLTVLPMAERGLLVLELHYPLAKKLAEQRQQESGNGQFRSAPIGADLTRRALEDAARWSNGLVTVRTLQRMMPVREAPRTQERIRKGEIKSALQAYQEALKEKGVLEPPKDAPVAQPRSAWDMLGSARHAVGKANEAFSTGNVGFARGGTSITLEQMLERNHEVRSLLDENERLAREWSERRK